MLKRARQYNIHLPLFYNDGSRIEPEKFEQVETLVLERYGGFTSVRQETPLRGSWRGEERIYTDMIIVILNGLKFVHFGVHQSLLMHCALWSASVSADALCTLECISLC